MFKSASPFSLDDPFMQGLACAALHPGLRSILVFHTAYPVLKSSADILTQLLVCTTEQRVEQVWVGGTELDDDLWGNFTFAPEGTDSILAWRPGSLAAPREDTQLTLVVIPDLTRLSLAAARAGLMLVGADVVHLERHGQHVSWLPNMCWLVGCNPAEIGGISPHLLDRFSLRLRWYPGNQLDRGTVLAKQLLSQQRFSNIPTAALAQDIQAVVRHAAHFQVTPTPEALRRIIDALSSISVYTPRREIALARLALAIAQLKGAKQMGPEHVDAAIDLLGLSQATDDQEKREPSPFIPEPNHPDTELLNSGVGFVDETSGISDSTVSEEAVEPVFEPSQTEMLNEIPLPTSPYPEDHAPIEREFASLRLPIFRHGRTTRGSGPVVGIERATTLRDLALVSTIFAAAPFQAIRRNHQQKGQHHFTISRDDFRSYRREPRADQLLLVLLDHTSLRGCDWEQALDPYLSWAYVERARIGIIQVGAANSSHELVAEVVTARSMLVPTIEAALEARPGKATPLAHGLDLALQTLRHALQHGRSTIQHAWVVVISDARGNVPLEASRIRRITGPVQQEGIEDALQLAQLIYELKGVKKTLLNPQPQEYPELPVMLAEALGAEIINIPRFGYRGV